MKLTRFFFLLVPALLFAIPGCKDACKDVTCYNGGTCSEGFCECPLGYEGSSCETAYNTRYEGLFNASEDCSSTGARSYIVEVQSGENNPMSLRLNNLYNTGYSVTAQINSDNPNSFYFENGYVEEGTFAQGTGSISADGNTIIIDYQVTSTLLYDDCYLTLVRQ